MVAHKEQLKGVRPRVNRAQLAKLGAQFAARQLQTGVSEASMFVEAPPPVRTSLNRSLSPRNAPLRGDALRQSGSTESGGSSGAATPQQQQPAALSSSTEAAARNAVVAKARIKQTLAAARAHKSEAAAAGGRAKQQLATPPWRVAARQKRAGAADQSSSSSSSFPEVTIFCPGEKPGLVMEYSGEQDLPSTSTNAPQAESFTFAPAAAAAPTAAPAAAPAPAAAAPAAGYSTPPPSRPQSAQLKELWRGRGTRDILQVLTEIQGVLSVDSPDRQPDRPPTPKDARLLSDIQASTCTL